MKKNNGAFLISFIAIIFFIIFGILGIKYLDFGVDEDTNVNQYGIVAKNFIESDDLEIWGRKDNLFVTYEGDSCGVIDVDSNVIIDIEYDNCMITSNGFIVNKNDKYFVLNRKSEIVLETSYKIENRYDFYSQQDFYIVNANDEKQIYDIESNNLYNVLTKKNFTIHGDYIIFEDSVTNYTNGNLFRIDKYYGSGKYLIFDLYKSNGYRVYDFANNKETQYSTLVENDYSMSFSNDEETLIIDYSGNILEDANIRSLNEDYSLDYSVCEYGFKVLNKEGKYVDDTCYSALNESALKYGYLYLYDDEEAIWTAIYSDNSLKFFEEEIIGEFVITYDDEIDSYVAYDRNGKKKDYLCVNSFTEINSDRYVCADLFNYYIVDKEMNVLSNKYDSIMCNDNSACVFKDGNGKYGLMIEENIVIEPSYYKGYIDDNYVIFEIVGGYEIYTLGKVEKSISVEDLKYEFNINYGDLSTEDVIKEYSLSEIEDVIYDNEELFKEYAYVILTNTRINGYRREILLMFDLIVSNKEHLNKEYFLLALDKLQINKTDSLEGTSYAGYYDDYEKKIELLIDDLNVINHELLHFIESNINYELNTLMYECGDEYYYLVDMKEFDEKKLATCKLEFFDYGNFIEEVGAEVNSSRYTGSKIIAYADSSIIYQGLVYLYGESFMEDVYFAADGEIQLYKKMIKSLSYEEYKAFIEAAAAITNSDVDVLDDDYIVVFNTLDKLYSEVIGGNWYDDNEYKFIMSMIYNHTDISEYIDEKDRENLVDITSWLNDLLLSVDETYEAATNNIGIYMLDGRTYLDVSAWVNGKIIDIRFEYDFENLKVLNIEVI